VKRVNKYLYGWKIYVDYGNGWEYECFETTYRGMKENRKTYRENCPYLIKITQGRETNPDYQEVQTI